MGKVFIFCLFATLLGAADASRKIAVEIAPKSALPVSHVIAGKLTKIRLAVDAPIGTILAVYADFAQVAGSLAAPLEIGVPIADEVAFVDRTHQIIAASIPVPLVRRQTKTIITFRARLASEKNWFTIGKTTLIIHPSDYLDELQKTLTHLENSLGLQIGVFGVSPHLRAFLNTNKIPFREIGEDFPASPKFSTIYLGETSGIPETAARGENLHVVIFDADHDLFPGIYSSRLGGGFIIKVTLPILHNLESDPDSQLAFATVFSKLLTP